MATNAKTCMRCGEERAPSPQLNHATSPVLAVSTPVQQPPKSFAAGGIISPAIQSGWQSVRSYPSGIEIDITCSASHVQLMSGGTSFGAAGYTFVFRRSLILIDVLQEFAAFADTFDIDDPLAIAFLESIFAVFYEVNRPQNSSTQPVAHERFNEQSMIDLKVCAAKIIEEATNKFWSTGRMKTHENKLIEKLLTDSRLSILAIDPDDFAHKEE